MCDKIFVKSLYRGLVMNKFKQKLISFMYGRYGIDELYYGLFALWGAIIIINMFVRSTVLYFIESAVLIYMLWRTMSRKIETRRRENRAFLKFWKPVKSWFILQKDRIKDHKNFRYRKCPKCRAILKLPNKKGNHTTSCPKCGNRFDVKIL